MKKSNFILELGFTLLFVVKKWYEGYTTIECNIYKIIAPFQELLNQLKECALQPSHENNMITDGFTFIKDFVLGFVSLCRSKVVFEFIEVIIKDEFIYEDFQEVSQNSNYRRNAINFFNMYTGVIEIVRNEKVEMVYFPLLPYAESFRNEQKKEWLQDMPIGKPRPKLEYIMTNSLDFLQQLKDEYLFVKTFSYYPVLGAIAKQIPLWKSLAFYLVIC